MDCFIYYLSNLWNFLKPQSCYELNIALMGLPNSGKSTFIKSLNGEVFEIDTIPTKYMEITTINYNQSMLRDLLGKEPDFKNFEFQSNKNNNKNNNFEVADEESSPLLKNNGSNNLNINIDQALLSDDAINEDVINDGDNNSSSNESVQLPDSLILKLLDLSGQFKYQNNLWKDIIIDKEEEYNINLIIFFIDVSDELRIQESKCKLLEIMLLNNDINRGGKQLPILIIGNKCDLIDDTTRPFLGGFTDVFDSTANSYPHNKNYSNNLSNNNNINSLSLTSSVSKNNDAFNNLLNDDIKSGSGTAVRSKRSKIKNHQVKYGNGHGSTNNNDILYSDSTNSNISNNNTNSTGINNNNSNNKKIINSSASIASKLFTKDELLLNFLGIEINDNKTRIFLTVSNEIYDNFLKKNENLNNLNKFTNVIRENLKFKLIELNFDVGIFTLSLKNDSTIKSANKSKNSNINDSTDKNKNKKNSYLNLLPSSPSIFDKRTYSSSSSSAKRSLLNDANSLKDDIDNLSDVLNWIFGIH